jgi:hypothetical protein
MPRASWTGFLRLSLVSCPIYLSPATTRTKSIRLHQVWRPSAAEEVGEQLDQGQNLPDPPPSRPVLGEVENRTEKVGPAIRGSGFGLTIRVPARKSRKTRSSGDTSMSMANTSRSHRTS